MPPLPPYPLQSAPYGYAANPPGSPASPQPIRQPQPMSDPFPPSANDAWNRIPTPAQANPASAIQASPMSSSNTGQAQQPSNPSAPTLFTETKGLPSRMENSLKSELKPGWFSRLKAFPQQKYDEWKTRRAQQAQPPASQKPASGDPNAIAGNALKPTAKPGWFTRLKVFPKQKYDAWKARRAAKKNPANQPIPAAPLIPPLSTLTPAEISQNFAALQAEEDLRIVLSKPWDSHNSVNPFNGSSH